jgi:hypothetical protein
LSRKGSSTTEHHVQDYPWMPPGTTETSMPTPPASRCLNSFTES